jgi:hypothetical protein
MPFFGVPVRNGLPFGLGSAAGFGRALPPSPPSSFINVADSLGNEYAIPLPLTVLSSDGTSYVVPTTVLSSDGTSFNLIDQLPVEDAASNTVIVPLAARDSVNTLYQVSYTVLNSAGSAYNV